MAKVDRKNKENQQGEKHSLSSFEKKRGAKVAFNYAQERTNKKYRVVNVQRESRSNSPVDTVSHLDKSTAVSENGENTKPVNNTAGRNFSNGQTANRKTESRTPDAVQKSESSITQPEKTITPEIAQRMKRAAFIAQKNEEAIRLNRASVVSEEENQDVVSYENDDYPEETVNVPLEHPDEVQEETQGCSYLGNSVLIHITMT